MSTSNNPEKYYRAGVAMPIERKAIFESRLQELGLKTVGDLVSLFTLADGVVAALKPVAERFAQSRPSKSSAARRKEVAEQLKDLAPDELERLLQAARKTPAQAA